MSNAYAKRSAARDLGRSSLASDLVRCGNLAARRAHCESHVASGLDSALASRRVDHRQKQASGAACLSGSLASGEATSIGACDDRILAPFYDAIFRPENPLSLPEVRGCCCGGGRILRYPSFVLWTQTPIRLVVGGA